MPHKPFPWYCSKCKAATIEPRAGRYEFVKTYEGREVLICIEDVAIPTCEKCGYRLLDVGTLATITEKTYEKLGLLTPAQIRAQREQLSLNQQDLQRLLGLGGNTLSRWENAHIYQSRVLDRFLRVFFASDQVRQMLELDDWTLPTAPVEPSYAERYPHRREPETQRETSVHLKLWAVEEA